MALFYRFILLFTLAASFATAQEPTLEQVTAELRVANTELATQKGRLDTNIRAQVSLSREAATISNAIAALNVQIEALALALDELSGPPIIIDPPPPSSGFEPSPDFSAAPFQSIMPAFPEYKIPTLADCEWTIANGVATSTRGLPSIPADIEGAMLGTAYRASIAAGHQLPITFGVWDNAGPAYVGGLWYHSNGRSITSRKPDGTYDAVQVEIVGLDDQCEVQTGWGGDWGWTELASYYNIGIRSGPDSFNIRANNACGKIILDGCWFLPRSPEQINDAAIHCANWHTLVVRRTKARGETPGSPYQLFRQHNFYFKNTGPGGLWVLENEFQGSNGTCFQIRPGTDDPWHGAPNGPAVIAYNRSQSYGWEHGNTAATAHGGAALTVWSSPDHPVFIYRNRILDARYACLVVSQQGTVPPGYGNANVPPGSDRNYYGLDGYPVGPVYIAGNEFGNERSQRPTAQVSGCRSVDIWNDNVLVSGGQWHLNGQWAATNGYTNLQIGTIKLYGPPMQGENFWTFDGNVTRRMTPTELLPLRVPAGSPVILE